MEQSVVSDVFLKFYKAASDEGGDIDLSQQLPYSGFESLMPSVAVMDLNKAFQQITYRKLFLRNEGDRSLSNLIVYISQQTPCPDDDIWIAPGTKTDTVADAQNYEYVQPLTPEDALFLANTLEPEDYLAIWIKRVVYPYAKTFADNFYELTFEYIYVV